MTSKQLEEGRDAAVRFSRWVREKGYIYVGEGDYLYPDADGLISGEDVYDLFIEDTLYRGLET